MKLSYIIPTYNAVATIVACLDSIYTTSLDKSEFEVICVDDCSTDDTVAVIRTYAQMHSNLILLCQRENHRQGAARNRGLEIAKGEYVTFVDSDDIIIDGIVNAIKIAINTQVDLVYSSCYHERNRTEVVLKEIKLQENAILSGCEFCEQYQQEGVFWYPWGILYKKDWLVSLNYPFIEDRQHEDRDWLAYVMSHADTITNSKSPMYRYVFNPNSTCRLPRYSTIFDHVASGIRHIDLSNQLMEKCPKLSATLYAFGVHEITSSLRLRHLTKYHWKNHLKYLNDEYLGTILSELRRICKTNKFPIEVYLTAYIPHIVQLYTLAASPIAKFIRNIKH